MGLTNFPRGITSFGMPVLGSGGVMTTGNVFFVDSGAVNSSDGNTMTAPDVPGATVDAAVAKCTANNGDVVFVMPGHSETLSAAAAWVLDVAGVQFIGLGTRTDRPKIIMDTAATVDINVTAANCGIHNFQFEAAFADIAKIFHVTAKDFVVNGCEFREQVATENWVLLIDCDGTTDGECDGLTFTNNVVIGADTANENLIKVAADITGMVFDDNYVELGVLDNDAIIEVLTGKDLKSLRMHRNDFNRDNTAGELLINADTDVNCTGIIAYNNFGCADVGAQVLIETTTSFRMFENYVTGTTDLSGWIIPIADSA